MSNKSSSIADLMATKHTTKHTVRERIERRLAVLREWRKEGVPAGKILPKSLNAARLWADAELEIQKISSPNEFTTGHSQHGSLVSAIENLLKELNKVYSRPVKRASDTKLSTTNSFDSKAAEQQLAAACSQWHSERSLRLQEKARADSAEARSVVILEENAKLQEIVANLRRQVASHKGLRAVE
ncbi:MAG: hypothetical protein CFE43_01945 [Burkholderiales bacterium PBB3]|nr:MAG: hypothetical protein CFE43_01945 [Burkholderiales bacterium PBB3]